MADKNASGKRISWRREMRLLGRSVGKSRLAEMIVRGRIEEIRAGKHILGGEEAMLTLADAKPCPKCETGPQANTGIRGFPISAELECPQCGIRGPWVAVYPGTFRPGPEYAVCEAVAEWNKWIGAD